MFEAANTLIEERLRAQWVETGIDWDNVDFTPVLNVSFVRLQIMWTNANSVSIGGRDKGEGYIELPIFVPANTGTTDVNRMADDLADIFNKWDTGQLKFSIAKTVRVGKQEEWYQLKVIVPFTYEECN